MGKIRVCAIKHGQQTLQKTDAQGLKFWRVDDRQADTDTQTCGWSHRQTQTHAHTQTQDTWTQKGSQTHAGTYKKHTQTSRWKEDVPRLPLKVFLLRAISKRNTFPFSHGARELLPQGDQSRQRGAVEATHMHRFQAFAAAAIQHRPHGFFGSRGH